MISPVRLEVYTSPPRSLTTGGTFSPTTSTLISGPTEAVLIDAQYFESDVDELTRRIKASNRTLTTVYITHAHADHYLGLGLLLRRFPQARGVALPAVVTAIEAGHKSASEQWREWFGGAALETDVLPTVLDGEVLAIDGRELRAIEVGQGDIAPSTIVHAPSIEAVVAGDVVYNGIHPFLAASGPAEWLKWIQSVDRVASLRPRTVVAGHKRPELGDDDINTIVAGTRNYICDFIAGVEECANSRELVARMQERYPDHGNPTALMFSAVTAFKRRKREQP